MYHYAGNNPVKYTDPDGECPFLVVTGIAGAVIGAAIGAYQVYKDYDSVDWKKAALEIGKDALIGGAIGLGLGATAAVALTGSATASVSVVATSAKATASITLAAASGGIKKCSNLYQNGVPTIGHYPEYVKLAKKINGKIFQMPSQIFDKMSKAEQWAANKKFLDRAISRNEPFNLATKLENMRPDSFYEEEVKYLLDKGYKLNEYGTMLLPPGE